MKLIDLLLRLYPADFRARYERDMRDFHGERLNEPSPPMLRIVWDHLRSATAEQLRAIKPDVQYALRGMARRPGFTTVVVLTIGLGVGANAAIFSVVNGILLRPLPYRDADRVVTFRHEPPQWLVSEPQYATYRDRLQSFQSLAAFYTGEGNLATREIPERVADAGVTTNFFTTLGVQPILGRTFAAEEDHTRPATVVVVSWDVWQRHFNGDPRVIGQSVSYNGIPRTVIGVMPRGFDYPSKETQLWRPACSQRTCASLTTLLPDTLDGWANHYLKVVGRVKPGISVEQAAAEATRQARAIMVLHPQNFNPREPLVPHIVSIRDDLVGATRPYLLALLGAVAFVLLIVCANVANLLLARGEARRREMALRTALGASRRRLVNQLMTESVVLALAGGVLGVALAWAGRNALVALAPASLPRLEQVRLDWMVVAFCFAVALVAGLVFGVVPSARGADASPGEALKAGAKGGGGVSTSRHARQSLVVAEVALAMVLLAGAGMLVRSLVHLYNADLGFRADSALTVKVSLNRNAYDDAKSVAFFDQLLARVRALPGVRAAGAARWLPVVGHGGLWDVVVDGKTFPGGNGPSAVPQDVTPGYFAAMGQRLLAGRDFTEQDRLGAPLVGVISRGFARSIWGGEDPLGKRFRLGGKDTAWVSVVGVVSDIQARGFGDTPEPTMYFAYAQSQASSYYVSSSMSLVLRTQGDPLRLAGPVRQAVQSLDASVPISDVRTLDAVVGTAVGNRRFATALIAGFAALALLLAGIGIYGVITYVVSQRTFEFGVRVALGADRRNLIGLVMSDGVRLAALGVGLGLLGSVALGRGMRSMLVDVPAVDVLTLAIVGAVLAGVALLASAIPARRATRVSPTEALRGEA